MIQAQIRIDSVESAGAKKWQVELEGPPGRIRSRPIAPLIDADLAGVGDLPRDARTWRGLVARMSPNVWRMSLRELRAVGTLIRDRILDWNGASGWFEKLAAHARERGQPIRLVIELEETAENLWAIPLEIAFDGTEFVFKRRRQPAIRCDALLEWVPRAKLARGDRLLIATAHIEGREPTRDKLREHAEALLAAAEKAGLQARWLEDATPEALREALAGRGAEPVDALYVACHGSEDPDHGGRLALRGRSVPGDELAAWVADGAERGHPLKVALLCACSSAEPSAGTLGMAHWLLKGGKALAAMGYRSPVGVDWALRFTQSLFEHIAEGASIEEAFAEARWAQPNDEPQWALPLLFGRRLDPSAPSVRAPAMIFERRGGEPSPLRSLLPRAPHEFFTAREEELRRLHAWLRAPGRAVITAVAGEGGVGKTELAAQVAHACRGEMSVLWLERPDRDLRAAAIQLLEAEDPAFRPNPEALTEDLLRRARERLRPHRGLLVLDDVSSGRDLGELNPGGGWNVLVTTRVAGLLSGVVEIPLQPLAPADAVRLLSRVAWRSEVPPEGEAEGAARLVERLGGLPLALVMAGETIRNEVLSAASYLEDIARRVGPAASDLARVEAVTKRSLETLGVEARRALQALAILPAPGARLEMVATALEELEPRVARQLDRLVRHHLASFAPEMGRYRLHPLMREAMRAEVAADPERWSQLHRGAARAMAGLATWVNDVVGTSLVRALERWRAVRDVFDALDTSPWLELARGAGDVAHALVMVDQFRQLIWSPAARLRVIEEAVRMATDAPPEVRANVLQARGDLRRRQADLAGAGQDYDAALALFKAVEDRLGEAKVLQARGDLRRRQEDLAGAGQDYDAALALFKAIESRLGEANVLQARGGLAREQKDLAAAWDSYVNALKLYEAVEDAVGMSNVLAEMARVLALAGRWDEARTAADKALTLATRAHNAYARKLAEAILAAADKQQKQDQG